MTPSLVSCSRTEPCSASSGAGMNSPALPCPHCQAERMPSRSRRETEARGGGGAQGRVQNNLLVSGQLCLTLLPSPKCHNCQADTCQTHVITTWSQPPAPSALVPKDPWHQLSLCNPTLCAPPSAQGEWEPAPSLPSLSKAPTPWWCPPECWSPHSPPSAPGGTAWAPHRSAHSTCQAQTTAARHLPAPRTGTHEVPRLGRSRVARAPCHAHRSSILVVALSSFSRICSSWVSSSHRLPQPSTRAKSLPVPRGSTPNWHCRQGQDGAFRAAPATRKCCRAHRSQCPRAWWGSWQQRDWGWLVPAMPGTPTHLLVEAQGIDLGEHPAHAAIPPAHQDPEGGELLEEAQPGAETGGRAAAELCVCLQRPTGHPAPPSPEPTPGVGPHS